ncbi:MAG: transposase, partial [Alphaproteobacteria bacterium]|nr:transposase [Alphaproteobacteria bacterium]
DVGVALPLARSDGQALPKDDGLVKLDKRKRRLQRELSRRDKQSNRRKKSREKAARVSRHIAARRKARLHQATTDLVRNFSLIAIEDLKVGNMTASAKGDADAPGRSVKAKAGLNREILNVAPFMFRTLLEYKTAASGVELIDVAPHYTSQTCNACGVVDAASRKTQSRFSCTHCGHVENADVNAAKNILSKALTSRGSAAVATRRKTPSDPYSGQLGTGTATLNPQPSPMRNTEIDVCFNSRRA